LAVRLVAGFSKPQPIVMCLPWRGSIGQNLQRKENRRAANCGVQDERLVTCQPRSVEPVGGIGKGGTGPTDDPIKKDAPARVLGALPRQMSDFNPVGLDFVVERLAADAEAFGGFEFVAVGFLEHRDDGVAFNAFQEGEVGVL